MVVVAGIPGVELQRTAGSPKILLAVGHAARARLSSIGRVWSVRCCRLLALIFARGRDGVPFASLVVDDKLGFLSQRHVIKKHRVLRR